MTRTLVMQALFGAVALKRPPPGLILHSDRGSQGGFNRSSQHL
jgi:transposase InsO family protein